MFVFVSAHSGVGGTKRIIVVFQRYILSNLVRWETENVAPLGPDIWFTVHCLNF